MIDIAMLLSAVKPKEQTDQYVILAAMFALDAYQTPTTVKKVTELLKLHLGRNIPSNINSSLRAYRGHVSPREGLPKQWLLTPQGVEKLRSLSGLALRIKQDAEKFDS